MTLQKRTIFHISISLLLVATVLGFLGLVKIYFSGKTLPGTKILNSEVGVVDYDEFEKRLIELTKDSNDQYITIDFKGTKKDVKMDEIGVAIDLQKTLAAAPVYSAKRDSIIKLVPQLGFGSQFNLEAKLDEDKFVSKIEEIFDFKNSKTQNAGFILSDAKTIDVSPEKPGEIIDTANLKDQINLYINKKKDQIQIKTINKNPTLSALELEKEKDAIIETLKRPVNISFNNQSWSFVPIKNAETLSFEKNRYLSLAGIKMPIPDTMNFAIDEPLSPKIETQIEIKLDEDFDSYIANEIAPKIDREMKKTKIYYDEQGKVIFDGTAENGQSISRKQLKRMVELAVNSSVKEVKIPVQTVNAQVESDEKLKEQGIKELIGFGRTTFYGSPANRVHNISVGINIYNGYIIKKGEEFSFNTILGPVEASTGYLPELVIKKEGTIPEYGGGLCQVSSTAYRAALFSGLPIVERAAHSYAVSYYAQVLGYGLDATIYPGVRDLKFINDTPGDILIQSYAKDGEAYFKFYGTSDNRSVRLEGPYTGNRKAAPPTEIIYTTDLPAGVKKQKENAHGGFDTTWFRYLTKEGSTVKETIFSGYRAMPAKVMMGTSEAPASDNIATNAHEEHTTELSS